MRTYTSETYIGAGKTVGLHRMKAAPHQATHLHDFIELVYIDAGEAIECVDDIPYRVKHGDMIFINCGSTHTFTSKQGFMHTEIFFSPTLVEEGVITAESALGLLSLSVFDELRKGKGGGKLSFHGEERKEIEFILSAMMKEYESDRADAGRVLEHYLNILLTKMRRASEEENGEKIMDDIWQGLKSYIDENPKENLNLASLASKSFYNPSYFSRMFKKKFGLSPTEYIRMRRIAYAKELLITESAPVEDILLRAGFTDRSSFYHAFSAETGMTPSEYRALCKKVKK